MMKERMIKVFLEFADHITEKDIDSTVGMLKSKISDMRSDIYPQANISKVGDMRYDTYLSTEGSREVVFDFINTKENRQKVKFSDSGTIKEVDGEIRLLAQPMPMGVQLYGKGDEGMPLAKAWDNLDIETTRKTNSVRGNRYSDNRISLVEVILVYYTPKEEGGKREGKKKGKVVKTCTFPMDHQGV